MEAQIAQLKLAQRTNQLVIVIAEAVEAEVSFWEKQDAKWRMKLQTKGYVGEAGIGNAREGSKVTPEGAFRLGQAFGKKDPGSKTAFRPITASDYWISNPESAYYNTWQQFQTSEMDESLYAYSEHQYEFARLIHYNTDPIIKGAGSAFFLHVENQVLKKLVKLHNSLSVNIPYISTFSGVSQFTLRSVFFIVDTIVDTIPVDNFLRQFAISNFTNR